MKHILVSIIVPIYNVEKYIEKCVMSLINQNHQYIEIILVDDGTPDNSGQIIDRLALSDERIIVIHKENAGVSSARNTGVSIAKGEYIMFVDGDDWVDIDYVSYFLKLTYNANCDLAMNINNYSIHPKRSSENINIISDETAIKWIYRGDIFVAVWNKIYKRDFLQKNDIFFDSEIWYGEGMLFNIQCLQYTDKVVVGEKSVYHQTFNPQSAMRYFNLESNYCGIKSLEIQRSIWKKETPEIEKMWKYHRYCFNRSIINGIIRSDSFTTYKSVFNECASNLRKQIIIPLVVEKKLKHKIAWIGYFISPFLMAKRAQNKFLKSTKLL